MKTKHFSLILSLLAFPPIIFSQQVLPSVNDHAVVFQKNEKIFLIPVENKLEKEITNSENLENKIWNGDLLVRFQDEISKNLHMNKDWVFYTGIQSPHDEYTWLCLERTIMGNDFNLFLFDIKNGSKKILIDNNSSIGNFAFRPLAWSADKNVIYFERIKFDDAYEHEGIYSYTINTAELKPLSISGKYMTTPVISPDRNYFIYSVTGNEERDQVHGHGDKLMVYSIESARELLLSEETGAFYNIVGWYTNIPLKKKQLNRSRSGNNTNNVAQLSFKFPWEGGVTYCVTRDGSNSPPGPTGSSTSCSDLGQHSYPAATDYDTPNNSHEKILAVAAGTVTTVIYGSTGYGNHVIVTHPDNYRTLYGHFFSINVTQGQQVQQGCYLGMEGTTGNSSGDHLHLEYEYPGGSGNLYATFDDCGGCVPHRGYSYTSGNSLQPCTAPTPPPANDDCSTALELTSNSTCVNVAGDLANATASGMAKASCDGFATPSLIDVWYKFTATAASHTVTITPSTDMDPVLSIYTACGSGEIECAENGGLGIAESIIATGLSVGTTYYVRVYDYGSLAPTTSTFDICITEPPITTGVNAVKVTDIAQFDVFPNPFDGSILTIRSADPETKRMSFKLHDMIGKEVFAKEVSLENGQFSISFANALSPGVYTLSGLTKGNLFTKKVVVK